MAITLAATLRNNRADQISTFAGASAKLAVYTAAYGTLLYTATCNASAFAPAAAGGVLTAGAVGNATAVAAGTAAIARLFKTDGTTMVMEGLTVGVGGSFNVNITNTTIAINDVVTTSSFTITEGNP